MIKELCDQDFIGEVIVVDNNVSNQPDIPKRKKLRVLEQEKNIYVNPAWNLGVSKSKFPICILLNDDLTFNTKTLNKMAEGLDEYGVIGMHHESYRGMSKEEEGTFEYNGGPPRGWGCVMCFKKKDWVDIPESMKIWAGDDWIKRHIGNSTSIKMMASTEMSTTSNRKEMWEIRDNDLLIWKKYLKTGQIN